MSWCTIWKYQINFPVRAILQQQAKFDTFLEGFNQERPHEALGMKCPPEIYSPSCRAYHGIPEPHYPFTTVIDTQNDTTAALPSLGAEHLWADWQTSIAGWL